MRDNKGHFIKGNKEGRGNPYAKQVNAFRSALMQAVQEKDIKAIVETLLEQAVNGNIAACRVLLDRLLGPPVQADILERLERLEDETEQRRHSA